MYMIVALAYVLVSGHPTEDPALFYHKKSFTSLPACQAYLTSQDFQNERDVLREALRAAATRKLSETADADESSPPPDIAITATCEEDHRI